MTLTQFQRLLERQASDGEKLARYILRWALPDRGMVGVKIPRRMQTKARAFLRKYEGRKDRKK